MHFFQKHKTAKLKQESLAPTYFRFPPVSFRATWTRLFDMGLALAEGQKLECFI